MEGTKTALYDQKQEQYTQDPQPIVKDPNSILNLSIEQLKNVIQTNQWPEAYTFEGLTQHPHFEKLFKHRNSPKDLAFWLIKYSAQVTPKERKPQEIVYEAKDSFKQERLELRKKEYELKKLKLETETVRYNNLYSKLVLIENMLKEVLYANKA